MPYAEFPLGAMSERGCLSRYLHLPYSLFLTSRQSWPSCPALPAVSVPPSYTTRLSIQDNGYSHCEREALGHRAGCRAVRGYPPSRRAERGDALLVPTCEEGLRPVCHGYAGAPRPVLAFFGAMCKHSALLTAVQSLYSQASLTTPPRPSNMHRRPTGGFLSLHG